MTRRNRSVTSAAVVVVVVIIIIVTSRSKCLDLFCPRSDWNRKLRRYTRAFDGARACIRTGVYDTCPLEGLHKHRITTQLSLSRNNCVLHRHTARYNGALCYNNFPLLKLCVTVVSWIIQKSNATELIVQNQFLFSWLRFLLSNIMLCLL